MNHRNRTVCVCPFCVCLKVERKMFDGLEILDFEVFDEIIHT